MVVVVESLSSLMRAQQAPCCPIDTNLRYILELPAPCGFHKVSLSEEKMAHQMLLG